MVYLKDRSLYVENLPQNAHLAMVLAQETWTEIPSGVKLDAHNRDKSWGVMVKDDGYIIKDFSTPQAVFSIFIDKIKRDEKTNNLKEIFRQEKSNLKHPYLTHKKMQAMDDFETQIAPDGSLHLIIPMYPYPNSEKKIEIISNQKIFVDSENPSKYTKRFATGKTPGYYFFPIKKNSQFALCEGIATAYAIHYNTSYNAVCCFSAAGICRFIDEALKQFVRTVVVIDYDKMGVSLLEKYKQKVRFLLPPIPGTDAWDTFDSSYQMCNLPTVNVNVKNLDFEFSQNTGKCKLLSITKETAEACKNELIPLETDGDGVSNVFIKNIVPAVALINENLYLLSDKTHLWVSAFETPRVLRNSRGRAQKPLPLCATRTRTDRVYSVFNALVNNSQVKKLTHDRNGWQQDSNRYQYLELNPETNEVEYWTAPQTFYHSTYFYTPVKLKEFTLGEYLVKYPFIALTCGMSLASAFYGYCHPNANRGFFLALTGLSRCGKTIAARVAANLTDAHIYTYEGTLKGILSLADKHHHKCLFLDELKRIRKSEDFNLSELIYTLTNGVGRVRARKDGTTAPVWCGCLSIVSTSEFYVEQCCTGLKGGLTARIVQLEMHESITAADGQHIYNATLNSSSVFRTLLHHIALLDKTQLKAEVDNNLTLLKKYIPSATDEIDYSLSSVAWCLTALSHLCVWLNAKLNTATLIKDYIAPSYRQLTPSVPTDLLTAATRIYDLIFDSKRIAINQGFNRWSTPNQECGYREDHIAHIYPTALYNEVFDGKRNQKIIDSLRKLKILCPSKIQRTHDHSRTARYINTDITVLESFLDTQNPSI